MSESIRQYALPLPHNERLTAEDFMITDSNREASAWVDRWPDWSTPCLIVFGPAGSGKTHLAEVWRAKTNATQIHLPFADQELVAPDHTDQTKWAVLIDNADAIAKKTADEEALFHLFNRVKEANGTLLLTAETAPAQWGIVLPDLRSRLVASPTSEIHAPDDDLMTAMLIKQFRDRQLQVESGVLDYILPRIERSSAYLKQLVENLDRASLATGRGITINLVRQILGTTATTAEQTYPTDPA